MSKITDKVRVTVLLETDVHIKLKVKAAKEGITMNNIMSDAIKMYLQQNVNTET